MAWTSVFPIVLAVVALSLPIWLTPNPLALKSFGTTEILQLLAGLFIVALLLERALEVFVTTWRGPGLAEYDLKVGRLRTRLDEAKKAQPQAADTGEQAAVAFGLAEIERTKYKCDTQRMALSTSLILGLLVSAVGIRGLDALVDTGSLSKTPIQVAAFHLVDVLLTGGLIAGGSEGIHKITQVFTNYMEATSKRIKAKGADG